MTNTMLDAPLSYRGYTIEPDLDEEGPLFVVTAESEVGARRTLERAKELVDGLVLFDSIAFGDRVTIRTPHGSEIRGRATLKGPHGWVLNCGGAHGTPRIATTTNIVRVARRS